jgi:two-component system chemotaxis response regulator CheB
MSADKPLRVLIVEDSLAERTNLRSVLDRASGISVVGVASDGPSAISQCRALRPDVITLDMVLPSMTGVEVTERIMAEVATPILVVSSATNRKDVVDTLDALAAGAVDVLEKPDGSASDATWPERLVASVRLVGRVPPITRVRPRPLALTTSPRLSGCRVIAMGASTGGPSAIASVLSALPVHFPIPILVVVHIASAFGDTFVHWLDGQCSLRVVAASDGAELPAPSEAGTVFVAPPDRHLIVRGGKMWLTRDPEVHGCRPAVDYLFDSLAREMGAATAACLLTGIGRDGAAGLLALRQRGAYTIAQDESTSVVFGMPREAARLGAAQAVLPLQEIGAALMRTAHKPIEPTLGGRP